MELFDRLVKDLDRAAKKVSHASGGVDVPVEEFDDIMEARKIIDRMMFRRWQRVTFTDKPAERTTA